MKQHRMSIMPKSRRGAGNSNASSTRKSQVAPPPFNWADLEEIHDSTGTLPLIPGFSCHVASGDIPMAVKQVAGAFARKLQQEMRYDNVTYTENLPGPHDIFFIHTPDLKVCVGVVIFENGKHQRHFSSLFNTMSQNHTAHLQNKTFPLVKGEVKDENEGEYFARKVANNMRKLDAAREQLPLMSDGNFDMMNFFSRRTDPKITKYSQKTAGYQQLRFYSRARESLTKNTDHPLILTTAFIEPNYRRRGLLSKLLPVFQSRYGVFNIDGPSDAMRNLIEGKNVNHLELQTPGRTMPSFLIS